MVLTGGSNINAMNKATKFNIEGKATSLPNLKSERMYHACGTFTKENGETVMQGSNNVLIYHSTFSIQFYMVTGGMNRSWKDIGTTEILKKEGGTSWQTAASLPSARHAPKGITLANGKFLVTGDGFNNIFLCFVVTWYPVTLLNINQ